jgi:hypothetical protein
MRRHSPLTYIEPIAVLNRGAPQVMAFPLNSQKHLIQVPYVARSRAPATQLIGILLAELTAPFTDGFRGHEDPTNKQQ